VTGRADRVRAGTGWQDRLTALADGWRHPGGTGIRKRLTMWMLVAVGMAVLLLGVPLAVIAREWIYSAKVAEMQLNADLLLDSYGARLASGDLPGAEMLNARLTLLDNTGHVVHDTDNVRRGTLFDDEAVRGAAGRDGVGAYLAGDTVVVATRGAIGDTPVILRLAEPAGPAISAVGTALVSILGLAISALAAGAALASWRARHLAEPLEALAETARRLGEGDFSQRAPRTDIAEINHIASALNATAARLRTALGRSASFSADASHQLRTPRTALRLNLDVLALQVPEADPTLAAVEAEVDRLESTIGELLALGDAGARPAEVDLRELVLDRLGAWRTLADAAGRAVRVTREQVPLARVRPAAVGQALQVLLDNALLHGRGDVTVWLEPVRRRGRVWVRLCVGDEGEGVQPQDLTGGGGRGLPLARSLVEAEGGALVVDADHGGRVCLLLPAVDDAGRAPVDDPAP
jgi:signal transduction histidine kinase